MTWWIITARRNGDDEDTMHIVQATVRYKAINEVLRVYGVTSRTNNDAVYINAIVSCDTEPTIHQQ